MFLTFLFDTGLQPHNLPPRVARTKRAEAAGFNGAAGKTSGAKQAAEALERGLDFVVIGRSAILHHDFPRQISADPAFELVALPVSVAYLKSEGLGDAFVKYMSGWEGFVTEEA